jgi:hypothetical protein
MRPCAAVSALGRPLSGFAFAAVLLTCSWGSGELGTHVTNAGSLSVFSETDTFNGASGGVGVGGTLTLVIGRCVGFLSSATSPTDRVPQGTSVAGQANTW